MREGRERGREGERGRGRGSEGREGEREGERGRGRELSTNRLYTRVLLLQNVFSYCRICSLTIERVQYQYIGYMYMHTHKPTSPLTPIYCINVFSYYRMCSFTIERVLLL